MACVYVYVIVLTLVGPEHLSRSFDVRHDDDMAAVVDGRKDRRGASPASEDGDPEKPTVAPVEKA